MKFQRIQLAFETLSNKQKRREYDSGEPFDESIPGQHLVNLYALSDESKIDNMLHLFT